MFMTNKRTSLTSETCCRQGCARYDVHAPLRVPPTHGTLKSEGPPRLDRCGNRLIYSLAVLRTSVVSCFHQHKL